MSSKDSASFTTNNSKTEFKKFSDQNPHLKVGIERANLNTVPINTIKFDYKFNPIDKSKQKYNKSNFNWQLNEFNY